MNTSFNRDRFANSYFLRQCQQELDELLKHKWIESEKAGHDIGYDRALLDWVRNYRPRRLRDSTLSAVAD